MIMSLNRGLWTEEEHDRFLEAIQIYPHGPWRYVAKHVGTKDVRQVQTHAKKYYEKVSRHMRGLRKERRSWVRSEHRIDDLPPGLQRSTIPPPEERVAKRSKPSPPSTPSDQSLRPKTVGSPSSESDAKEDDWLSEFSDGDGAESPHQHSHSQVQTEYSLPSLEESLDILLSCLSDY